MKNNLTIARRWGGGVLWGEGFSGTTVKDSWTKPRGRVEAREGGEFGWGGVKGWGKNADNCNPTTIK